MISDRPRLSRAYTLLELLVVISIISTIAFASVAGIRSVTRVGELDASVQLVRSMLRRARNTAREERFPARVEIDLVASELRAMTRQTLAMFRFEGAAFEEPEVDEGGVGFGDDVEEAAEGADEDLEGGADAEDEGSDGETFGELPPETITGTLDIEATLYNTEAVAGKLGVGLLFGGELAERDAASWVEVEERPSLSPTEGVYIEVWVQPGRLEEKLSNDRDDGLSGLLYEHAESPVREAPSRSFLSDEDLPLFTIARKGRSYELLLNADYSIEVAFTGLDEEGEECSFVARSRSSLLRSEVWARVAVVFDGRSLELKVDGLERGLYSVDEDTERLPRRLLRSSAPLTLSDPDPRRSFYGVLDEFRLAGIVRGETVKIPPSIFMVPDDTTVVFDALGQLDPLRHSAGLTLRFSDAADFEERLAKLVAGREAGRRSNATSSSRDVEEEPVAERERLRLKRRVMRVVEPRSRRDIIVDLHGTLR
jgi:prepilin-type N-terminal cleavage/methylation domain-containing protein